MRSREQVAALDAKGRAILRKNVAERLRQQPNDPAALQRLEWLNETQPEHVTGVSTGLFVWKCAAGLSFAGEGFVADERVASISKNKNHTHTNDSIYTVEVLGERLADMPREIASARALAEAVYKERQSS